MMIAPLVGLDFKANCPGGARTSEDSVERLFKTVEDLGCCIWDKHASWDR